MHDFHQDYLTQTDKILTYVVNVTLISKCVKTCTCNTISEKAMCTEKPLYMYVLVPNLLFVTFETLPYD